MNFRFVSSNTQLVVSGQTPVRNFLTLETCKKFSFVPVFKRVGL